MKKIVKVLLSYMMVVSFFVSAFASDSDETVPGTVVKLVNDRLDLARSVIDRSYGFLFKGEKPREYKFNKGQVLRRVNINMVYENPENNDISTMLAEDVLYMFCLEGDNFPLIYAFVSNSPDNSVGYNVSMIGGVARSYYAAEEVFRKVTKRENEDVHYRIYSLDPTFEQFIMVCRIGNEDFCIPFDQKNIGDDHGGSCTEAFLNVTDYRELPTVKEYLDACRRWIADRLKEIEKFHREHGEDEIPVGGAMFDGMKIAPKAVNESLPSIKMLRLRSMTPYLLTGAVIMMAVAVFLAKSRRKVA